MEERGCINMYSCYCLMELTNSLSIVYRHVFIARFTPHALIGFIF